jgi:hypothetical protein
MRTSGGKTKKEKGVLLVQVRIIQQELLLVTRLGSGETCSVLGLRC